MKICKNCGYEVSPNEQFCSNCGGTNMEFSDTENNTLYNSKLDSDDSFSKKKLIILSCIIICFITSIFILSHIANTNANIQNYYARIQQNTKNGNYEKALNDIESFSANYGRKAKLAQKASQLKADVEEKAYKNIVDNDEDDKKVTACNKYISYFPNGKYTAKVKKTLADTSIKVAKKNIDKAQENISNGEFISANNLLQQVVNDKNITQQDIKEEAQKLSKSISRQVKNEIAKDYIVGSWIKSTGVCYTFEPNGHMSVSMSEKYDASKGNSLDGFEVNTLLREISTYGRIIRGGTWKYEGLTDKDLYSYSLHYDGGFYSCVIGENEELGEVLGIGSALSKNQISVLKRASAF